MTEGTKTTRQELKTVATFETDLRNVEVLANTPGPVAQTVLDAWRKGLVQIQERLLAYAVVCEKMEIEKGGDEGDSITYVCSGIDICSTPEHLAEVFASEDCKISFRPVGREFTESFVKIS